MTFDVTKHLIKVQGGRNYLPVQARLLWFREEHSDWGIETKPVHIDYEKQFAVFSAIVKNSDGVIVGTGTKMEDVRGFGDWLEKAETGAIGRALGVAGFGTQFAPDLDEGNQASSGQYRNDYQDRPRQGNARQVDPATGEIVGGESRLPADNERKLLAGKIYGWLKQQDPPVYNHYMSFLTDKGWTNKIYSLTSEQLTILDSFIWETTSSPKESAPAAQTTAAPVASPAAVATAPAPRSFARAASTAAPFNPDPFNEGPDPFLDEAQF